MFEPITFLVLVAAWATITLAMFSASMWILIILTDKHIWRGIWALLLFTGGFIIGLLFGYIWLDMYARYYMQSEPPPAQVEPYAESYY